MSEKIKVLNKKTGVTRWVTVAAYEHLKDKLYKRLDDDDSEIESTPDSPVKKNVGAGHAGEDDDIEAVRAEWKALMGKDPDGRKGVVKLKEEIEELKSSK